MPVDWGCVLEVLHLCAGKMPGLPMISFGVVDNRDVVDLHLRAMTHPAAKGERFLAVAGDFITFPQFAQVSIRTLNPTP